MYAWVDTSTTPGPDRAVAALEPTSRNISIQYSQDTRLNQRLIGQGKILKASRFHILQAVFGARRCITHLYIEGWNTTWFPVSRELLGEPGLTELSEKHIASLQQAPVTASFVRVLLLP
jgi:hypothetical protein